MTEVPTLRETSARTIVYRSPSGDRDVVTDLADLKP